LRIPPPHQGVITHHYLIPCFFSQYRNV
jgi:hypothetical protein